MKSETPRNDALKKCAAANPKHLIEIMLRKHEQLEIELNEANDELAAVLLLCADNGINVKSKIVAALPNGES